MSVPITPETRLDALLGAYPALEETLIGAVPAFEKLRNPVLRQVVARSTTLEQAARLGGINVVEMVRALRTAAGQEQTSGLSDAGLPDWVSEGAVRKEIDADPMLARGVHPIGLVREAAAALAPGEMVRLLTSFRPEPLIETMRRSGFTVACLEIPAGRYATYVGRAKA
ncbi:MAG: DUF1858 domain-containing protein [Bryobacterales bacterium]|nr:DUF1858 domain-containing protein [Bryobacterales bacterium]